MPQSPRDEHAASPPESSGDAPPRSPRDAVALGELYRYSGLGLQFAAAVAVFTLVGRWLDARLGTSPWLLLFGVFLGLGLGLYSLIKKLPTSSARPRDPS
jgi:F0F1-type ATP synthase assembly protein I